MATSSTFIVNGTSISKCTLHKRYRAKTRKKIPTCAICKQIHTMVHPPVCAKHPHYQGGLKYPNGCYDPPSSYTQCKVCLGIYNTAVQDQKAKLDAKPRKNRTLVTIRRKADGYMLNNWGFERDHFTGYRPNSSGFSTKILNRYVSHSTKKLSTGFSGEEYEVIVFRPTEIYPLEVLEDPKFIEVLEERGKNIQVMDSNARQEITPLKETKKEDK